MKNPMESETMTAIVGWITVILLVLLLIFIVFLGTMAVADVLS